MTQQRQNHWQVRKRSLLVDVRFFRPVLCLASLEPSSGTLLTGQMCTTTQQKVTIYFRIAANVYLAEIFKREYKEIQVFPCLAASQHLEN